MNNRSDIGREWRLGCVDGAYNTIRMEELGDCIGDSVRPMNAFESQGKLYKADINNTSNDVQCRYMGSEESAREEVGCGGN